MKQVLWIVLLVCVLSARVAADDAHERWIALTDSLRFVGKADSALTLVQSYHESAVVAGDSSAVLLGVFLRGKLLGHLGRYTEAIPLYHELLAAAAARGDTLNLCRGRLYLGTALDATGKVPESIEQFEMLRALAVHAGDRGFEAHARMWLARRANFEGRFEEAKGELQWVIAVFDSLGEGRDEVNANNLLGISYYSLADLEGAAVCFQRCVDLGRALDYPPVEAQGLNNLALVQYALGDPGSAMQNFVAAYELNTRIGRLKSAVLTALNVGEARIRLGLYGDALDILHEALRLARENDFPDYVCAAHQNMAMAYLERGSPAQAAVTYRTAMALARAHDLLQEEFTAALGLSRALARADSVDAALAVLDAARPLKETARVDFQMQMDMQRGAFLVARERYAEAVPVLREVEKQALERRMINFRLDTLTSLSDCYRGLAQPDSALALLERAIGLWEEARALPLDPRWREERGSKARKVYARLADLSLEHPADTDADARVRATFDRMQRFKARTLQERMLGPGVTLVAERVQPTTLQTLQTQVLRPGELLLDAYEGEEETLLFAVTSQAVRVVRIPHEERRWNEKLEILRDLVATPSSQTGAAQGVVDAECARVGALLMGELEDWIATAQRILFAPDGQLYRVPLGVLSSGEDAPLLLERDVIWIPSPSVLARFRQARPAVRTAAMPVLAIAGRGGEKLPEARREVRDLGRRYAGVDVRTATSDAGPTLAIDELAGYDVLHIAAHTRVDDENPWRSGITLDAPPLVRVAAARSEPRSGVADAGRDAGTVLRASRIAQLQLPARLAVLAGCESAGGRIVSGEGVLGLTSAFLSAGVPAVVATLWPVDDRATAQLMERFYANLAHGQGAARALRTAQLDLRRQADTREPYYWAGFILVGEGDTTVDLVARTGWTTRVLVVVALIVAVMAGVVWMRRRVER